jgi:small subunit ribosomal protein S8
MDLAKILLDEGYISGSETSGPVLTIRLKYAGRHPAITGVTRISRPGRRVYARRDEIPRVLGGLGIAIVSTSSGVMTGREARRKGLGGEVLAQVW